MRSFRLSAPRRVSSPWRSCRVGLLLLLLLSLAAVNLLAGSAFAQEAPPSLAARPLPSLSAGSVHICRLEGAVDLGMARYLDRVVNDAARVGAAIVIIVESTGGRVDAALAMRDSVLRSGAPTIAFVDGRAWSAAALIAMAAEVLVLSPGSSIGAAEPDPLTAKTVSALRSEFEATAEARGRDPKLAAAMVDADLAISGLVERGRLLSMTASVALTEGFSDGTARTLDEALALVGLADASRLETDLSTAERAARFVTHPTVAPILLTIAFVALVVEVLSAGFGGAGIVGLAALALFFGGHIIAGFGGWEVAALFVLGLVLLLVEAFMPGFGVFGVAGVGSLGGAVFLASRGSGDTVRALSISIVSSVLLSVLVLRVAVRRGWFSRLQLGQSMATEQGYVAREQRRDLIGQTGVTLTMLRPSGTARFGAAAVDVVSEGTYVPAGTEVTVIHVEGPRVVVRPSEGPPG